MDSSTLESPIKDASEVEAEAADRPVRRWSALRLAVWLGLVGVASVAMVVGLGSGTTDAYPIELMLRVETLPRSSMKAYSLRLPRPGDLEINVSSLRDDEVSVYLVRAEERLQVSTNAQRLIAPFTAEHVRGCRRTGWLPAGDYRLTLVNSARDTGGVEPVMSIYARLDP